MILNFEPALAGAMLGPSRPSHHQINDDWHPPKVSHYRTMSSRASHFKYKLQKYINWFSGDTYAGKQEEKDES